MKTCPYCAEEIQDAAIKCKHCGEFIDGRTDALSREAAPLEDWRLGRTVISCGICMIANNVEDPATNKCMHCGEFLDGRSETRNLEGVDDQPVGRMEVKCGFCSVSNNIPKDAVRFGCTGCHRVNGWSGHGCGWYGQVDPTISSFTCPQCGKMALGPDEKSNPHGIGPGDTATMHDVIEKVVDRMTTGGMTQLVTRVSQIDLTNELPAAQLSSRRGCPACGSLNRYAKRSGKGKFLRGALGVTLLGPLGASAAALGHKNRMRCVDCGFES